MDKKSALENLDLVFMTLDELVDGGCVAAAARRAPPSSCPHLLTGPSSIILETDASVIASRVSMRGSDGDVPLSEQTFAQALASAKEQLARSLLS